MKAFITNFSPCLYRPNRRVFSINRNHSVNDKKELKMLSKENLEKKINFLPEPFQKKKNFLEINTSIENLIIKLQESQGKDDFINFCYINREFLSYELLYRLTVLKLRSEGNQESLNQGQKVETFRKKILENTMFIDQAVAQSLILGEKRIKEILDKSQDPELVTKNIGENRISVSCFWVVLFASLIAWETKNLNEGSNDPTGTYQKLLNIKNIFIKSEKHQQLLAIELKNIQNCLLTDGDLEDYSKLNLDSISGLKLLISQLEKLPSSSYGPLLKKISDIYNEMIFHNYGTQTKSLQQQFSSFTPTPIKTKSKLVEIQQSS